jgi:hypothetical protein
MSISDKFKLFCTRREITYFDLSEEKRRLIEEDIQKVRDAEKPERKMLPNLSILTYQICKRLDIEIDKKFLKIPVSKASHDRCIINSTSTLLNKFFKIIYKKPPTFSKLFEVGGFQLIDK